MTEEGRGGREKKNEKKISRRKKGEKKKAVRLLGGGGSVCPRIVRRSRSFFVFRFHRPVEGLVRGDPQPAAVRRRRRRRPSVRPSILTWVVWCASESGRKKEKNPPPPLHIGEHEDRKSVVFTDILRYR